MKILLINHYAGSLYHGMEYRPYYLGRAWVAMGHTITIAAATVSHVRTILPKVQKAAITQEMIDGIQYLWFKTLAYDGNGVSRAINILTFVGQLLLHRNWISRTVSPDVVIASSTYPLDIIAARAIAKKSYAKLVFEVHDLWPLTLLEIGNMHPWNPFILLLQWAENYAYRISTHVISMLSHADSHMIAHGMLPSKFSYIPNGVDPAEWGNNNMDLPDEHFQILDMLKTKGNFIVGYTGGHNISNALEFLIEAALLLKTTPVLFVLVGKGTEKSKLESSAGRLGLRNVFFLSPVPKRCVPLLLNKFDAVYIGWRKEPIYQFGISPNKLLDYMMAARPVIHAVDAPNDWVAESGCGISIPPENPHEIAQATLKLMNLSEEERIKMGQRGKAYILANHDYRVLAKQFIDLLEQ